jgi:hypothetical protein
VTILVDGPVSSETFTEMGVQADLIATTPTTTERYRAQDGSRFLRHEAKVRAGSVCEHSLLGRFIGSRLANNIAKALRRKICAQDDQSAVIEAGQARVRENCIPDVVERATTRIRPDRCNLVGVLMVCSQRPKGCNSKLKVMDVFAVELGKANEFGDITNDLRLRPRFKELMLRLSRPVPLGTNIIADEFKP